MESLSHPKFETVSNGQCRFGSAPRSVGRRSNSGLASYHWVLTWCRTEFASYPSVVGGSWPLHSALPSRHCHRRLHASDSTATVLQLQVASRRSVRFPHQSNHLPAYPPYPRDCSTRKLVGDGTAKPHPLAHQLRDRPCIEEAFHRKARSGQPALGL